MEWHSLVKRMDAEVHLDVGGATTPDEFDRIALTIAFALSNPCECFLDFHVHMMCLFYKKTRLVGMWNVWQNMSKMCIPKQMVVHPQFGEFKEPATVLDQHGHIILWHLPFIFSHYRMVNTFCFFVILNPQYLTDPQSDLSAATVAVRRPLDSFMKSLHRNSKTPSWRHSLFDPPSGGGIFGAGVLNMSPGWFQQSQDVSFITDLSFF